MHLYRPISLSLPPSLPPPPLLPLQLISFARFIFGCCRFFSARDATRSSAQYRYRTRLCNDISCEPPPPPPPRSHNFVVGLARHATSMTSVCPSVRLAVTSVDCDHTVQHKVEISTRQDRSVSLLPACRRRPGSWYPVIQGIRENVEFCSLAAFNSSHVALSQHLQSFILRVSLILLPLLCRVACLKPKSHGRSFLVIPS